MDQEIKNKWIEALRSGKYEQGKHYLKRENKFDVLGVLCDISEMGEWQERTLFDGTVIENYFNLSYTLHPRLCEKAKLSKSSPILNEKDVKEYFSFERLMELSERGLKPRSEGYHLIDLNDCGATFEELADLIERYL